MAEDTKEKNINLFFKKLAEVTGVNNLFDLIGEKLKNATFSTNGNEEICGEGTFIKTLLYTLTPFAIKLNDMLPEDQRIDKNTLVKVCLLHQIAKSVKLIPNDNSWEIEKRGLLYKYDNTMPSIRTGLHSLVLAQQAGITFTPEEAEAMTVNDRELSDEMTRWHQSRLSSIIRMANELTYITKAEKR